MREHTEACAGMRGVGTRSPESELRAYLKIGISYMHEQTNDSKMQNPFGFAIATAKYFRVLIMMAPRI